MLISIAIYILFWIYGEILWRGSVKLRNMTDTKKLAQVTMRAGCIIFGLGEIILTRSLAGFEVTENQSEFSSCLIFIAFIVYLITTLGAMTKRDKKEKAEIFAISVISVFIGLVMGNYNY